MPHFSIFKIFLLLLLLSIHHLIHPWVRLYIEANFHSLMTKIIRNQVSSMVGIIIDQWDRLLGRPRLTFI
jgi:hypothetical protein